MLEASKLRIVPAGSASIPQLPAGDARIVQNAVGDGVLGYVVRPKLTDKPWLGIIYPARILVYEAVDMSLLCFGLRPWNWFGNIAVSDADEELIASIRDRQIVAPNGELLADWCKDGDFFAPDQTLLGTGRADRNATELAFSPASQDNPWLRMAMLMAVLFG